MESLREADERLNDATETGRSGGDAAHDSSFWVAPRDTVIRSTATSRHDPGRNISSINAKFTLSPPHLHPQQQQQQQQQQSSSRWRILSPRSRRWVKLNPFLTWKMPSFRLLFLISSLWIPHVPPFETANAMTPTSIQDRSTARDHRHRKTAKTSGRTDHDDSVIPCPLTCVNGGQCQWSHVTKAHNGDEANTAVAVPPQPSCHCPRGFTGDACQIAFRPCPTISDATTTAGVCFNAQHCVHALDRDGKSFSHCECDPDLTDLADPTTRRFCETEATVFCEMPSSSVVHQNGHPTVVPKSSTSHCTNGGQCRDPHAATTAGATPTRHAGVVGHVGCDCPHGYTGDYCEVPTSLLLGNNAAAKSEARRASLLRRLKVTIALLCILVLFGMVGFFVYHGSLDDRGAIRTQRQRRRQRRRQQLRQDDEDEDEGEYGRRGSRRNKEQEMTTVSTNFHDDDGNDEEEDSEDDDESDDNE